MKTGKEENRTSGDEPIRLSRIAVGVRYQPRYTLLDTVGAVVDRILRSPGTPFGPETFPVSTRGPNEHALLHEEQGNLLRISQSDAILELPSATGSVEDAKSIASDFDKFVLENLRELGKLRDIIRYGILFKCAECSSSLAEMPAQRYLSPDFTDTRSLSMRFTRRLPTEEALAKRSVEDFRNVIYTIKQTEEGEVSFWVDYQHFFKPLLSASEWSKKPFPRFVERGISYFEGEFQAWVAKFLAKSEAA